jgi:hypothetical protein
MTEHGDLASLSAMSDPVQLQHLNQCALADITCTQSRSVRYHREASSSAVENTTEARIWLKVAKYSL